MQRYEKKKEKEERLKLFYYIKQNLSVCIAYIEILEDKKKANLQKEKKEILNFMQLLFKGVAYFLEKEDEIESGDIGI